MRDPASYRKLIPLVEEGLRTAGLASTTKENASKHGLTGVVSARLQVDSFARNFFLNHYSCYLHLELEGNFDRWLFYFGLKYGKEFCVKVNERARYITESNKESLNISSGIYKFDSKRGPIVTKKYSGRERSAVALISCLMYQDLLNKQDMVNFSLYIDYLFLLMEREWDSVKIEQLEKLTFEWKSGFVETFDPEETISGYFFHSFYFIG